MSNSAPAQNWMIEELDRQIVASSNPNTWSSASSPCPPHELCHQASIPTAREKLETLLESMVLHVGHSPFSVYVRQRVFGGVSQLPVKLGEI